VVERVNAAGPDEVRAVTVAQQPEPESSKAPNSARGFGADYSSSTPDAVSACVATQQSPSGTAYIFLWECHAARSRQEEAHPRGAELQCGPLPRRRFDYAA